MNRTLSPAEDNRPEDPYPTRLVIYIRVGCRRPRRPGRKCPVMPSARPVTASRHRLQRRTGTRSFRHPRAYHPVGPATNPRYREGRHD